MKFLECSLWKLSKSKTEQQCLLIQFYSQFLPQRQFSQNNLMKHDILIVNLLETKKLMRRPILIQLMLGEYAADYLSC